MAKLEDLIKQIPDPKLRADIAREAATLKATKKFGLVFEDHIPEQVQLPNLAVQTGARVIKRGNGKQVFQVLEIKGKTARLAPEPQGQEETAKVDELVVVKNFGEPIYPTLTPRERVERAPDKPWHTIINADNFHALQLLLYCYEGMVDVIYIDPPYNTGARDWKYNNDYVDGNDQYRHSKWLAMMKRRLLLAKRLLAQNGIICITIDDNEVHHLTSLIEDYLDGIVLGTIVIKNNPAGRSTVKGVSIAHEYALLVAFSEEAKVSRLERTEEQKARYKERDNDGWFEWVNFRKHGGADANRSARRRMYYPIYAEGTKLRLPQMEWNDDKKEWTILEKPKPKEAVIYPVNERGEEKRWKWASETFVEYIDQFTVRPDQSGKPGVYMKSRMNTEGILPNTVWDKSKYSASDYGTNLLQGIFDAGDKFSFPKSLYAVADCLKVSGADNPNALILDFFAGSGTTLHATALLNSEDNGNRRCILVTNNEVNEKLARQLNEQGIFVGQPEFERHGICESATWLRNKIAFTGKREDGFELSGKYLNDREMKDGFEENIEYFRLDFLDPHDVAVGEKFESILSILWLMAGAQGKRENDKGEKGWFIPKNSPFAILVDEHAFTQFKKALAKRTDLTHIFIVTDSLEGYQKMIAQLPEGVNTKMLYKSYLDNFKINIEQSI